MSRKQASPRENPGHRSAPAQSPEHLALRKAARRAGQDEETLRDLLWLINAHDRLLGFPRIARNLLDILTFAEESARRSGWTENFSVFSGWTTLLEWITEEGFRETSPPNGGNPLRRHGITRHPLYSTLWHRPAEPRWRERYAALQWHLLWAHASFLFRASREDERLGRSAYEAWDGEEMWEAFPSSPYVATLSVRELAEPGWGPLLKAMPAGKPPRVFAEVLNRVECPGQVPAVLRRAWPRKRADLQSFLSRANGPGEWLTPEGRDAWGGSRGPRHREEGGLIRLIEATPGDADDPDTSFPEGQWVTKPQKTVRFTPEEILELDLDPDEIDDPDHLYLVEQQGAEEEGQPWGVQSALAARGQFRQVQMAHQLLPWEFNQLALQEVASLLRQGSEAVRKLPKPAQWDDAQGLTAELVTLIHVMLWTGSSLERAQDLRVLREDHTNQYRQQQMREADLLFDLSTHQWRIHAASPEYRSEIPDPEGQAYPRELSFPLPDVARTEIFLRLLLSRHVPGSSSLQAGEQNHSPDLADSERAAAWRARHEAGFLFSREPETYCKELKKWLRLKSNNPTERVTPGRLGSFLFSRLTAITGDVTAAVAVTGQSHPLARTQQYYSTYSIARLQEIYLEATSEIVRQAHQAAGLEPPEPPAHAPSAQDGYVGARLCARPDAVKDAVRRLQEQLEQKKRMLDWTGTFTFHNLYTLYTVLMFGYATSMRAIRTPYLTLEQVDRISGFALLSDKDDDAEHKSRLAWIPPFVLRQMEAYADHVEALISDRRIVVPPGWTEPCFFLAEQGREEGKLLEVRPRTLIGHMKPYLHLPVNAHRRFMRHELQKAGCPPEVANAWLGHAFQGQEPWGPYSSFSFANYRISLEQYLLPILMELGWKTLTSPLC